MNQKKENGSIYVSFELKVSFSVFLNNRNYNIVLSYLITT